MTWTQPALHQIVCDGCTGPGPMAVSRGDAVREAVAVGWTCRGTPLSSDADWRCPGCSAGDQPQRSSQAARPTSVRSGRVAKKNKRFGVSNHLLRFASCVARTLSAQLTHGRAQRTTASARIEQATKRLLAICVEQGVEAVVAEAMTSRELLFSLAEACHRAGMTDTAHYLLHLDKVPHESAPTFRFTWFRRPRRINNITNEVPH